MKEFWNSIQLIFSAVGGWLGYFLGGCDGLLYTLLAFVVLDYVTGIMCAVADKKLSSAVGPVEGQRIQCQTGPYGAGCIYSAQYYQQQGRYDKTPRVGDQVFFQSGGQIGHTGIVVAVTDSTITTVEGNSSDQVKDKPRSRETGSFFYPV